MKRSPIQRKTPLASKPSSKLEKKPCTHKCKVCKEPYIKRSMTHVACKPECAEIIAKERRLKQERTEYKRRKEDAKTRSDWLREVQIEFNSMIRERDSLLPCISCGNTKTTTKYNAGHYLSVGARPQLRFNEDNVHKQCEHCNSYLSGNIAAYRPRLISKIGVGRVEWLEGPHDPVKYTIDELKAMKALYRKKLKDLKRDRS